LSNVTDVDALAIEPGVGLRLVADAAALGDPDLIVLPGSKATVSDLAWLRSRRLDAAIAAHDATVLGICGGYQMPGRHIVDAVESGAGAVAGLGCLDATTVFGPSKVTRQRRATAMGEAVTGYAVHHGVTEWSGGAPWMR